MKLLNKLKTRLILWLVPRDLQPLITKILCRDRFESEALNLLDFYNENFESLAGESLTEIISKHSMNCDKEIVFTIKTGRISRALNSNNILIKKLKERESIKPISGGMTITESLSYKEDK